MKHNEKAVKDMARLLFEANPEIDSEQKFEEWRDEFDPMAVAVLDAMVPPAFANQDIAIGDEETVVIVDHWLSIMDGTANLGGDRGKG